MFNTSQILVLAPHTDDGELGCGATIAKFIAAENDVHQDHQVVFAEGLRAFKNSNVLGYELPWNNFRFQPNYFEKITEQNLQLKLAALKEYKSQSQRKYMSPDFIRSLAVV